MLLGPSLLLAANVAWVAAASDAWKRPPEFRPVTADAPVQASGHIAYVERPPEASSDPGPGCVWVVRASGGAAPRRLGCSGDGVVPEVIHGLWWTASGNLRVLDGGASVTPPVLRVGAGRRASSAIPELRRRTGYRNDGTLVDLAEVTQDRAELAVTPPRGTPRTIVSFDGPDTYSFALPQWSPDGKWILVSDSLGRLLILDEQGDEVRELLPPNPAREWIEQPFLTWHQGRRP